MPARLPRPSVGTGDALPTGVGDWRAVTNVLAGDLATVDSGLALMADVQEERGRRVLVTELPDPGGGDPLAFPFVVHAPAGWPLDRRLAHLKAQAGFVLGVYPVDLVVLETHPFGQALRHRQATVEALAMARAVVMVAARAHGVPCVEFPVNRVREALGVRGGTDLLGNGVKDRVKEALRLRGHDLAALGIAPADDNAADAIALLEALCPLILFEFRRREAAEQPVIATVGRSPRRRRKAD